MTEKSQSDPQELTSSAVLVRLLKAPVYRARHRDLWEQLERQQFQVREYFQQIGLSLRIDDAEGYAFLQQTDQGEDDGELPRLITRRALTFGQTLLLVQIRKRLAEHDANESDPRLILSRQEIHQWLSPFFSASNNEIKQQKEFDSLIKKVSEMGFLTSLKNHPDAFEVQRIIKAMITAEQIGQLIESLKNFSQQEA